MIMTELYYCPGLRFNNERACARSAAIYARSFKTDMHSSVSAFDEVKFVRYRIEIRTGMC